MEILSRIWEGNLIYKEPVCFSEDAKGHYIGGNLLYQPTQILSVTSFDDTIFYREGKDYKLEGQKLILTENSQIPFLSRDVYCKTFTGVPETAWVRLPDGQQYIEVISDIYRWQVLVTYTHNSFWNGFYPADRSSFLPKSIRKLQNGGDFNLIFYGDSITAGWEASGCNETAIDMVTLKDYRVSIRHAPYQPTWAELVSNSLQQRYPQSHIIKKNRAAGGSTVQWGSQNAASLVNPCNPNLVILAFGMNSMNESAAVFHSAVLSIIRTIRKSHPDCEFLLVSPMIPNPEIGGFQNNRLSEQQESLYRLAEDYEGICIAPVHSIFCDLIAHKKEYLELTGNCINHPNDFSIRIYAQTILSVLGC